MSRPFSLATIAVISLILGIGLRAEAEDPQSPPPTAVAPTTPSTDLAAPSVGPAAPAAGSAAPSTGVTTGTDQPPDPSKVDFQHEDTYIDISDAVRSKQYVHRAILSSLIRDTSRFYVPRFYINHLVGFSSVYQRAGGPYAKYASGNQGFSLGYVTQYGHGVEFGAEFSNISNLYLGYRYFIRPKNFSLWGFIGGGYGFEVRNWSFADGPVASKQYFGPNQMGFGSFGLLVPIVDIGIKAEVRISFYGLDRIVFTDGVGVILFL